MRGVQSVRTAVEDLKELLGIHTVIHPVMQTEQYQSEYPLVRGSVGQRSAASNGDRLKSETDIYKIMASLTIRPEKIVRIRGWHLGMSRDTLKLRAKRNSKRSTSKAVESKLKNGHRKTIVGGDAAFSN